jgi:hypothetical protein
MLFVCTVPGQEFECGLFSVLAGDIFRELHQAQESWLQEGKLMNRLQTLHSPFNAKRELYTG